MLTDQELQAFFKGLEKYGEVTVESSDNFKVQVRFQVSTFDNRVMVDVFQNGRTAVVGKKTKLYKEVEQWTKDWNRTLEYALH